MSELTLHCVGDVYAAARTLDLFGRDPSCAEAARAVLSQSDVRFANLEAPLLDSGSRPLFSTGVRLRSPVATLGLLRHLGFEVMTLANNHLMDFGPAGLHSTLEVLDAAGLHRVGAGRSLEEA